MQKLVTQCCIAGGGPAGMMLGLLLARAGVKVTVLEKHADFLRDFRGDTIHPSTLQVMQDLGLLERFLALPHQEVAVLGGEVGGEYFPIGDFRHLPTVCRFIALMPQWDFLDFIADEGRLLPSFELITRAEVTGLIEREGRVVGVRATTPDGPLDVSADLVVGADGRRSVVRREAGFEVEDLGAPMDVLWFRVTRRSSDGGALVGRFSGGHIFIPIDRGEFWQCAYVIPKGGFDRVRAAGLDAFRASIVSLAPFLADRTGELTSWDDIKLLTVGVNRLKRWHRPGVLCIGDAAHTMSPIGGVGINLAIQDAVAAANRLAVPLREGRVQDSDLAAVQARRMLPTRLMQRLQVMMQERIISPVLERKGATLRPPWLLRLFKAFPVLQRIPGRLMGLGFRPERVQSPDVDPLGSAPPRWAGSPGSP